MLPKFDEVYQSYIEKVRRVCLSHDITNEYTLGNGMHFAYISDTEAPKTVLVFTAGIHGVEGYVASAMLEHFLDHQLGKIDLSQNAVVIVNFINSWGMRQYTRATSEGIDLNRNFRKKEDMPRMTAFPDVFRGLVDGAWIHESSLSQNLFYYRTMLPLYFSGYWDQMVRKLLSGQISSRKMPFYGGAEPTDEHLQLMALLKPFLSVPKCIVLDLHTGIGNYGELAMLIEPAEAKRPFLWRIDLEYPNIHRSGEEGSYDVIGDFTAFLYEQNQNPIFFSATLEFGIQKRRPLTSLPTTKHLILEHAYRVQGEAVPEDVRQAYFYDYYPKDEAWWEKATLNFDRLMQGMIAYHHLYNPHSRR